jgi:hypothetical protein
VAGLFHDFLLLSQAEHPFTAYREFVNDQGAVQLHDELIGYLMDSLKWLPSYNPSREVPTSGLCRWGPTIIHLEGADTAYRIFTAWADLFSAGPPVLNLTGEWTRVHDEPPTDIGYEPLAFDRDETVDRLRLVARYASSVVGSGGDLYILHIGV